jgi:hypothetical protein
MKTALQWLFCAAMTFFVGLDSVANGGAFFLGRFLNPSGSSQSGEPYQSGLVAVTLALTAVFLLAAVLATWNVLRHQDDSLGDGEG